MATKKKMLQAAAGNAGGAGLDVDEVFSTYLYEGNGSSTARAFENGIDLAGEGGLVWTKGRSNADQNALVDTERMNGGRMSKVLNSDTTSNAVDYYNYGIEVMTPSSTGYDLKNSELLFNGSSRTYASWTFRKAPKFFDVVTYTGNSSANQWVSHNLEATPGMVIIKQTSGSNPWYVWHRNTTGELILNGTNAQLANFTAAFNDGQVYSTGMRVDNFANQNGQTYVAYFFAHNDGDGEFGPDGDADIVKCGSYTGNGADQDIDIGFEPQWILVKSSTFAHDWYIYDTMRGFKTYSGTDTNNLNLKPNESNAESDFDGISLKSNGIGLHGASNAANNSGQTYIYMAIRRGPMATTEDATEVFDPIAANNSGGTFNTTGFPVDLQIFKPYSITNDWFVNDRMRGVETSSTQTGTSGPYLSTNDTGAEIQNYMTMGWTNEGFRTASGGYPNYDVAYYNWKRAPGFCDVVAYTGNSVAGRTVSHSLGVVPEMIWVKRRDGNASWWVYTSGVGNTNSLNINDARGITTGQWNNTTPTDTVFTLGSSSNVNGNTDSYIAYFFATLAGVSKCGSYTGNGTSQTIGCGFTSGARFILVKRTDNDGDWYVWDTERGIVAGNDPHLSLNTEAAEVTSDDSIDPDNSGFIVNQVGATNINVSSASYIFYAIA